MSGICGVVLLDGGKPTDDDIARLTAHMAQRGPDGLNQWRDGPIALGHALLATTPEALVEMLPLADRASSCTITADARLDNRDELIAALGIGDEERVVGDGELILRAYRRWGENCPGRLLGDFAFAIWDGAARKLFCARDHMGMRQLVYCHVPGSIFAFATDTEALFTLAAIPRQINRGRIADFIDNLEGLDFTSTFFEEVFRLPPAHTLSVDCDGLSLQRYWILEPPPPLELASDDAYAAAFLDVFTEAVRCRLRSPGPVGAMLSGGMDSGSVVAIAAPLLAEQGRGPLQTISAIDSRSHDCVETRSIRHSAAMPGISPSFVDHAELGEVANQLIALADDAVEPFDTHMTLVRAVYLTAHRAGLNIMLDGATGDVALIASDLVAHWLRRGRVGKALREALGQESFWNAPGHGWRAMLAAAWASFVPLPVRVLKRRLTRRLFDAGWIEGSAVSAEFAAEVDLPARRRRFQRHHDLRDLADAENRAQKMRHPHVVVGRERYDRVAAALGIEPRDPFLDIRVLQFCLSLPAEQLEDDGWPKMLLRRAMSGRLPDATLWRTGKQHLGWNFTQRLFDLRSGWRKELRSAAPRLAEFTDPPIADRNGREQAAYEQHYLLGWLNRQAGGSQGGGQFKN